jgi:transaldolase
MPEEDYLHWLTRHTRTAWWHDSADPAELALGLQRGAVGVTTNPYLAHLALRDNRALWAREIGEVLAANLPSEGKAEALMRIVVTHAADQLTPEFERSEGRRGYVCAQVNPAWAGDRDRMLAMAKRFHVWASNIAVKLPATAAGLDVLEECAAEGITVTATVSFTVPQVIAIAERFRLGIERANRNGIPPAKAFAVIMIGRLDDYLRDVARDSRAAATESDIRQAGLAVAKRACSIYKERRYEAVLLVAALRGAWHMTELAGANLVMSIAPKYQGVLLSENLPREERIDRDIDPAVVERLWEMPEFRRAYAPDGMAAHEFLSYGLTQRTLAQFQEAGWSLLENFKVLHI